MAAAHDARRKFTFHDLPERCFTSFAKMRSENQLCDISISVGKLQISAHRLILGTVIPYFADRLSEDSVILDDVEPSAVACLIDYAYTSEVNIDTTNVKNLLVAACLFGIDEVKKACCDFLSDGLEPENAQNVRDLGFRVGCSTLWKKAERYMAEHFDAISRTRDFLDLSLWDLEYLIDRDYLNVEDEGNVLNAVLRWVKYSREDRTDHFPRLLCRVRLPLIEPEYLEIILRDEELIREIAFCECLVEDALKHILDPGEKDWAFKSHPRRKKKTAGEILCIYMLEQKTVRTIQSYDLFENKFFTEIREVKYNPGSAVHFQKKIYFFYLCTTIQYDPTDRSMISMCRMPTVRDLVAATVLKDLIYICGGTVRSLLLDSLHEMGCTNVVECFDPTANIWLTVTEMPTRRDGLSAVTLNECIYAIGGGCKNNSVNAVEKYDPGRDRWTRMTPMLNQRSHAGAATLNSRIYVCGGVSSDVLITSCEMYDPDLDNWVSISTISDLGCFLVLLPFQQKLYAIGGLDSDQANIRTVRVYNPETDKWTLRSSKNSDFFTSGAVAMDAVDVLPEMAQYEIS